MAVSLGTIKATITADTKQFEQGMQRSKSGMKGAAVAAGAVVAALAAMKKAADIVTDAWREQEEANRVLMRGLRTISESAGDAQARFDLLQPSISKLAKQTMFGDEALAQMAGTFLMATDNAHITATELELIADVAEATGMSASKAAEQYARAIQGELSPRFARLIGLTTEQTNALNDIEDATERAARMQAVFSERVSGAASDMDPYLSALKNVEDAKGDILQATGKAISENREFIKSVEGTHETLRGVEAFVQGGGLDPLINELTEAAKAANLLAGAAGGLTEKVKSNEAAATAASLAWLSIKNTLSVAAPPIGLVRVGIWGLNKALGEQEESAKNAVVQMQDYAVAMVEATDSAFDFIVAQGGVVGALKAVGEDALEDGFLSGIRKRVEKERAAIEEEVKKGSGDTDTTSTVSTQVEVDQAEGLRILREETAKVDRQLQSQMELQEGIERRARNTAAAMGEQLVTLVKTSAEERAREGIARQRLDILLEEDELKQAEMAHAQTIAGIKEQELSFWQEKLALAQAEQQHAQRMAAIQERRAQEEARSNEQRRREINSAIGLAGELGSALRAAGVDGGSGIMQMTQALDSAVQIGQSLNNVINATGAIAAASGILGIIGAAAGLVSTFTGGSGSGRVSRERLSVREMGRIMGEEVASKLEDSDALRPIFLTDERGRRRAGGRDQSTFDQTLIEMGRRS